MSFRDDRLKVAERLRVARYMESLTASDIRLHMGELSAQEMRTIEISGGNYGREIEKPKARYAGAA